MKAKELFLKVFNTQHCFIDYDKSGLECIDLAMKNFAKLHVQKALQAASEKVKLTDFAYEFLQEEADNAIDKESILNSYDLNLIK